MRERQIPRFRSEADVASGCCSSPRKGTPGGQNNLWPCWIYTPGACRRLRPFTEQIYQHGGFETHQKHSPGKNTGCFSYRGCVSDSFSGSLRRRPPNIFSRDLLEGKEERRELQTKNSTSALSAALGARSCGVEGARSMAVPPRL
jgi:hypothetical protein